MNNLLRHTLATITLLTFCACSPSSPNTSGQASTVNSSSPPSSLPNQAIQQAALQQGREIATEVGKSLSSVLLVAIQEGGPTNAIPLCSVQAVPLTASLANKHGVSIRRVSHRPRNPANQANQTEIQLIEKYQTQKTAIEPLLPMLQPSVNGGLTFYAPITIATNLCLNCHGIPGETLAPGVAEAVAKLYAEDQATGFRLGDLRGLWRIDLPSSFIANLSLP
jgi:nitrate reductase cytochrome c-type subunit